MAAFSFPKANLFPKPLSDVSPQLLLIINGMLMPPVGAVGVGLCGLVGFVGVLGVVRAR